MFRCALTAFMAGLAAFGSSSAQADSGDLVRSALYDGDLAAGRKRLEAQLESAPKDDVARLGLALVQWSQGLERTCQSLYRYGAGPHSALAMMAGPLAGAQASNPDPAPCSYEDSVKMVSDLLADLTAADAALGKIESADLKFVLEPTRIRLDFNGDGRSEDDESLGALANAGMHFVAGEPESQPTIEVALDRADVEWLRAYGHVLMALCEMRLAYDGRELFERAGHLAFPRNVSPYEFLKRRVPGEAGWYTDITDAIAAVHLMNFKLTEPERMKAALGHWQAMVLHSRAIFEFAEKETDDDREWIPNTKQKSILPEGVLTPEMVTTWRAFLAEADDLLAGKKLVPFWRDAEGKGVNLYRAFNEPRDLDIVLWIQGTAAAPYLEAGDVTKPETWERFQTVFRGNFIGFAIWIN